MGKGKKKLNKKELGNVSGGAVLTKAELGPWDARANLLQPEPTVRFVVPSGIDARFARIDTARLAAERDAELNHGLDPVAIRTMRPDDK